MEKPSIIEVLEHYGAERVPTGDRWRPMRCVFHEDASASASVHSGLNRFRCFACDINGDSIDIIQLKEGLDFASALERASEVFGGEFGGLRGVNARKPRKRVPFDEGTVSGQLGIFSAGVRRKPFAGT